LTFSFNIYPKGLCAPTIATIHGAANTQTHIMATATAAPPPHTAPVDPSRGSQRRRRPRRNPNAPADQQEERQTQVQAPAPALPQSQRGGRSGRGRGGARGGHNEATRPSAPQAEPPNQDAPPSANRGGGRGGRARGRGPRFGPRMAAGGRQFGGQLTVEDDGSEASLQASSNLQPDAATFQPGQPVAPRKRQPREKKPQAPKSSAADIATRTHEDIDNGHYECAICTEEIRRHARGVWSCRTCWTVFHLGCIKKWSTNEGSAAARQQAQDGELPPPRQWRCPGCNLPKDVLPKNFHCWCEKELDPKSPSLAARHVPALEFCRRVVLTHVLSPAMPALAHLAV
jgi:transcriptional repressor NF-X1